MQRGPRSSRGALLPSLQAAGFSQRLGVPGCRGSILCCYYPHRAPGGAVTAVSAESETQGRSQPASSLLFSKPQPVGADTTALGPRCCREGVLPVSGPSSWPGLDHVSPGVHGSKLQVGREGQAPHLCVK